MCCPSLQRIDAASLDQSYEQSSVLCHLELREQQSRTRVVKDLKRSLSLQASLVLILKVSKQSLMSQVLSLTVIADASIASGSTVAHKSKAQ